MYTLSNVNHFNGMEGFGFSVDLLEDGVKIGKVKDDAYGGTYNFSFLSKDSEERFYAFIGKQPPILYQGVSLPVSGDIYIYSLLTAIKETIIEGK